MKARAEETFQPEVGADISTFLNLLKKSPADLVVGWALAPDGPKVVAYRVRGTNANALIASYVAAVRASHPGLRSAKSVFAGRDVTVTSGLTPERGYLYAKDDVLYATSTRHTPGPQLRQLLAELP